MECESRDLSEPLRQGDVFRWTATEADPWTRFGVIITADCDFAKDKFGGILSYCPILTMRDYLSLFVLSRDLERQAAKCQSEMARDLARTAAKARLAEDISPEIVPGWIARRGAVGVLEDVGVEAKSKDPRTVSLVQRLTLLADLGAVSGSELASDQIRLIARAKAKMGAGTPEEITNEKRKYWEKVTNHFAALPGDLFFLNHLHPDANDPPGYLVYLRRIGDFPAGSVAVQPRQVAMPQVRGVRIGRLAPSYRYRLTQQLASVFSDIGLSSEYEELRRATINDARAAFGVE